MPIIKKPDYNIFASEAKTGEIVDFPNLLRGWGVTLDQTAGKPPMEWFNALQKRTDEWLTYLSQRGLPEWQNTLDYPKDAVVQFGGKFYVAKKNTKNAQPDRSQNDWALFSDAIGVSGALQKTANLSDVADKSKARGNLGLGTAATKNVGTGSGNVMEVGAFGLGGSGARLTGDDKVSSPAALIRYLRGGGSQVFRVGGGQAGIGSDAPAIYLKSGDTHLVISGGYSSGIIETLACNDAQLAKGNVAKNRLFGTANPPKPSEIGAADVRNNFAAKMGENRTLLGDSQPTSAGVWSIENNKWTPEAWGTLFYTNNRPDLKADKGNGQFHHYLFLSHSRKLWVATNVNGTWSGWQQQFDTRGGKVTGEIQSTSSDNYRIVAGDYGTFWRNDGNSLYLLLTKAKDPYGTWNNLRPFIVDVKTGQVTFAHAVGMNNNLTINGAFRVDKNISIGEDLWVDRNATVAGTLKVGNSTHASDGNIMGSRWGNKWLWDAVIEQVSGRVDWGSYNRDVGARATNDYVNGTFIKRIRLGPEEHIGANGVKEYHGPKVLAGFYNADWDSTTEVMYWRPIQYLIGNNWIDVGFN